MSEGLYRLDRWLVTVGLGSRKEIAVLVRKGLVSVNGKTVSKPGVKVTPSDTIIVDGAEIRLEENVYYMMNKPAGVISATEDKHTETVLDLLPDELQRPNLFPAGRLDKDTEGFMLITNDGDFTHRILSPRRKVPKTYFAVINRRFDFEKLAVAFSEGVVIGRGEETSGAKLELVEMAENPRVTLVIYEGMFHQVKRMFEAFDLEVVYLKRIKIGGLALDSSLKPGETRPMTNEEVFAVEKP